MQPARKNPEANIDRPLASSCSDRPVQPKTVAIIALALARLQRNPKQLIDLLLQCFLGKASTPTSQDVANFVWAIAKLDVRNPELMEAIAVRVLDQIRDFNPKTLDNTGWA